MVFTRKDGIFMGYVSFREGMYYFNPLRKKWIQFDLRNLKNSRRKVRFRIQRGSQEVEPKKPRDLRMHKLFFRWNKKHIDVKYEYI